MFDLTACVAVDRRGRDCGAPIAPDAPVPLCLEHIRDAYLYFADLLRITKRPTEADYEDAERDPVRRDDWKVPYESFVYYILIGNHIKIGTTTNMSIRMSTLQPDHIYGVEPGGVDVERERHRQFAHLRASKGREYFSPGSDLMEHIKATCVQPPKWRPFDAPDFDLPGYIYGVLCPSCDLAALHRRLRGGPADCTGCGRRFTAEELVALAS